ncbi:hypothetical protein B0T16DRAFT_292500, partial [Cercophora newfieldiana]
KQIQGQVNVADFRRDAFEPEKPMLIKAPKTDSLTSPSFPGHSLRKWFKEYQQTDASDWDLSLFHDVVPYELLLPTNHTVDHPVHHFISHLSSSKESVQLGLGQFLQTQVNSPPAHGTSSEQFFRFEAPLALMVAAIKFNDTRMAASRLKQLYIAQAPLNMLPGELQRDLFTPELVLAAGKGDIYDSSVWIGLEPTFTPWHRDPNPNLFHQLWSRKEVRLLPPQRGAQIFRQTRAELGMPGDYRIRGSEMMVGAERQALFEAIWGEGAPDDILSASLGPGDALFVPKGWWHSVRSEGQFGEPNASVNWWFR